MISVDEYAAARLLEREQWTTNMQLASFKNMLIYRLCSTGGGCMGSEMSLCRCMPTFALRKRRKNDAVCFLPAAHAEQVTCGEAQRSSDGRFEKIFLTAM